MKKSLLVIVMLIVMLITASASAEPENVYVDSAYRTDSAGNNIGADFWVDSTVIRPVYVIAYITNQENVTGAVISGKLLLRPNEKHAMIGSFLQADRSKAWTISVGAKWDYAD